MKERLITFGFDPVGSAPEQFAEQIKLEIETWGTVIRAANIRVQ
jgi:tripartite-type tricarboxylate transporter receptor subunit TctC